MPFRWPGQPPTIRFGEWSTLDSSYGDMGAVRAVLSYGAGEGEVECDG